MPLLFTFAWPLAAIVVVMLLFSAVKILRQYERAVVFTLGKFQNVRGPGLVLLVPFIQEMVRVDLRIQVIEIPTQDVISRDNVSMKVDAVLYFKVSDPERAIIQVQDYLPATNMLAQTTLRAVLGQHELDEMLAERKKLSADVQSIIDIQTETWGIKVSNVEIRTVELTENMTRRLSEGKSIAIAAALARAAPTMRGQRSLQRARAQPAHEPGCPGRVGNYLWRETPRLTLAYPDVDGPPP